MYVCTICGFKKSELGSNPEFEFRRRVNASEATHLEGISDWCDKCAALRFFFKSDMDTDPAQELEELQPTKKLAFHALAASTKRQQNELQAKRNDDLTARRVLERELDVLKQQLLASLPSQLPRGCMWERQLRSASVDRAARRRQRDNPLLMQRSKSLVNEAMLGKRQFAKQQVERRDKHVNLTLPADKKLKVERNDLEDSSDKSDLHIPKAPLPPSFNKDQLPMWQEEVQKQENQLMAKKMKTKAETSKPYDSVQKAKAERNALEDSSDSSDLNISKAPLPLSFIKDQLPTWKEEVQKQVNQLMTKKMKTKAETSKPYDIVSKLKAGNNGLEDSSNDSDLHIPKAPLPPSFNKDQLPTWQEEVQKQVNQLMAKKLKTKAETSKPYYSVQSPIERLTKDEMISKMQELHEDDLKSKLKEKRQQMSEWRRIRRYVDSEYDRIREEINDMKLQADTKRNRSEKQTDNDRMKGGANMKQEAQAQETVELPQKTIGDALDEKIALMLDTLQENKLQLELEQKLKIELQKALDKGLGKELENQLEKELGKQLDKELRKELEEKEKEKELERELEKKLENESEKELEKELERNLKNELENGKEHRQSSLPADQLKESKQPKRDKHHVLASTVQRACFQGFVQDPQELLNSLDKKQLLGHREPPLPQFQTLPCPRMKLHELMLIKRDVVQTRKPHELQICRVPIYCPDSNCHRMFFMSDFNEHLTHEHPTLAMERIKRGQVKTFFMNTCATVLGKSTCNMVYFINEQFDNKNTKKMVPILVMSGRFRLTDFFAGNFEPEAQLLPSQHYGPDNEIFLIWLTAVRMDDAQIMATVSVWPASKEPMVEYLTVNTSEVYDIRCTQKPKNLYDSNRTLMLSGNTIHRMTNGGKHFLAVQVLIH
ncbi:calponin homology domain-containing protein DDB_G0272472 [Drosophila nasuta]|uniref:calponin homology domain-containing protein DDB_G0272472 n=1 Tax=Drosophila nasuta TaxID=42062 RepID=UPI00295E8949|nr:calponin homology domain-containing protein DDB_G0272472 [Drosophila nasuta]